MNQKQKKGKVILVGAGPGDTGLITVKGKEMLREAQAVVYDWLVHPKLLDLAPRADKIFMGKKIGDVGTGSGGDTFTSIKPVPSRTVPKEHTTQKEINQILLKLARQGKLVVRLKGGDPFLFGRGGEEASFLAEHRIPFEVVPGVSAGIGVPAYAGIPLTDRRFASQVTFITGHEDPTKDEPAIDWKKLAGMKGTLVFFMGVKNLPRIVRSLLKSGKPAQTPIAVIEWGTLPQQRVVTGTLKDILQKTKNARIESPALTVLGEVVRLRPRLAWFDKKPLRGKTILVTRARAQASTLVQKLEEEGARVLEYPTIEILPPSRPQRIDRQIRRISKYDWIVFTSTNAVASFFERMKRLSKDARIFSATHMAAIGTVTAQALAERGIRADLVPLEFTSLALFRSLKKANQIRGKKFLLVRADIAPPDLKQALQKEGASVVEVEAYRSRRSLGKKEALSDWFRKGAIDYVTFTSSSTVKHFFEQIPAPLRKRIRSRFVSIGPVTSRTLKEYGFNPAREAQVHTIDGLVEALVNGGRRE